VGSTGIWRFHDEVVEAEADAIRTKAALEQAQASFEAAGSKTVESVAVSEATNK
jgi:hypothetical protein